jgi:hypothetical protein
MYRSDAHAGARRTFRGSSKRIRRIKIRGNGSWGMWFLLAWVIFLLAVVIPWMIRHSP